MRFLQFHVRIPIHLSDEGATLNTSNLLHVKRCSPQAQPAKNTMATFPGKHSNAPRPDTGEGPFGVDTPMKIKIEPENDGVENDVPFPAVYSQIPC